jgi:multimeric flavodoxin WrbA
VALFRGAKQASDDAVAKVKKAGVPVADNGKQVADQFVGALSAAGDNFGRAAEGVQTLPTTDRTAFYHGVVKVGDQLSKDNNKSSTQLSTVRSKDLEKAFDKVPECR